MTVETLHTFYWIVAAACAIGGALGLVGHLRGWAPRPDTGRVAAWAIPGCALAAVVVALWIARWIAAGHLPKFGTYESALSLAAATMLAATGWELRHRFRTGAGPVAALVCAALLVHAGGYDRAVYALTISERSWVVDVHSVFAWAAFGVLATNAGVSLRVVLFRGPPSEPISRLVARTLELGFVLHTGMLITGSLYKFMLFGDAWSFDPIESLGLAAWIAYGALVHMVRFARWDGRRLAGWCLFLFVVLVVTYRFIVYYPSWSTYHIFDMDLRMHLV